MGTCRATEIRSKDQLVNPMSDAVRLQADIKDVTVHETRTKHTHNTAHTATDPKIFQ